MRIPATRYGRLGLTLSDEERETLGTYSRGLRDLHAVHRRDDDEDDLLELADALDMIAMPIVITRTRKGA